jgi:hypothetical protein
MSKIEEGLARHKEYRERERLEKEQQKEIERMRPKSHWHRRSGPSKLTYLIPDTGLMKIQKLYDELCTQHGQDKLADIIEKQGKGPYAFDVIQDQIIYNEAEACVIERPLDLIPGYEHCTLYLENGYASDPIKNGVDFLFTFMSLGLLSPSHPVTYAYIKYDPPKRFWLF